MENENENENVSIDIDESKNNSIKDLIIAIAILLGILVVIVAIIMGIYSWLTRNRPYKLDPNVKYEDIIIKDGEIITTPEQFIYFYNRLLDKGMYIADYKITKFSEYESNLGKGYKFDVAEIDTDINFIKSENSDNFSSVYIGHENSEGIVDLQSLTHTVLNTLDFRIQDKDNTYEGLIELIHEPWMGGIQGAKTIGFFDCVFKFRETGYGVSITPSSDADSTAVERIPDIVEGDGYYELRFGTYIVGEDIPAGTYDIVRLSGSGNFGLTNSRGDYTYSEIFADTSKRKSEYLEYLESDEDVVFDSGDEIEIIYNLRVRLIEK